MIRWVTVGLAGLLVVAACTSTGDLAGNRPAADTNKDSVALSTSRSTLPTSHIDQSEIRPAQTLEELEARWVEQRSSIVDRAVEEGWGVGADNVLRGPGGLEVDLKNCPAGWDPAAGVSVDSVVLSFIGTFTTFGLLSYAGAFNPDRFERINQAGGISGLDLQLDLHDDGYQPEIAAELVAKIAASAEQPLAVTTAGWSPTEAAMPILEDACIPNLLPWTNHDALTTWSWTTPLGVLVSTETAAWGKVLATHKTDQPLQVAALVMNNEFGWRYRDSYAHWAEQNPDVVDDVTFILHDPVDVDLDNSIQRVVNMNPDAVLVMSAANFCTLAVSSAELSTLVDAVKLVPSHCTDESAYMIPGGQQADGWLGFAYHNGEPFSGSVERVSNPPWDDWVDNEMAALGYCRQCGGLRSGLADYGWLQLQVLTLASELPGGLNRPNLLLAMWSADFEHPGLGTATRWTLNGPADPAPIETLALRRWDSDTGQWIMERHIANEGESVICDWDGQTCQWRS